MHYQGFAYAQVEQGFWLIQSRHCIDHPEEIYTITAYDVILISVEIWVKI